MSNLESARASIEAELTHAKQGAAHYQARITALENTLSQLASISTPAKASSAATKRPAPAPHKAAKAKAAKVAKKSKRDDGLPSTGGDIRTNLITTTPQSNVDILNAAVASMGIAPNKDQIKKLNQRLTFALNALVNTKQIKDSGKGRERRFFKN